MRRNRMIPAIALCLTSVVGMGCGDDDPTNPGDNEAQVSVGLTDDNAAAQASLAPGSRTSLSLVSQQFTGTMSADVNVELVSQSGATIDLGNPASVAGLELQSDGQTTALFANVDVPADTYTAVRLTLDDAQVDLNAGGTIGLITLTTDVTLTIQDDDSDSQIVIDVAFSSPTQLTANSETTFAVDLNSEAWITESAVNATAVMESEVESATVVSIQ